MRDDQPSEHEHQLLERLEEAAVEAELETGKVEETLAEAKAHIAVRLARMSVGGLVLIAGIAMIPLPGPGWLAVAAGLAILARDVAWADRALRFVRRKVPGVPEDGKVPRSAIVTMVALGAAGFALSLWWTLR
ncbi:MAG: PGPGW domain-containing protein [Acidimicrobiales bacterium]